MLAEFEDGTSLGVVHATLVRSFRYTDELSGEFENGGFWGLVEFSTDIGEEGRRRLAAQDLVRLRSDPDNPHRRLPVAAIMVEPVRDVRGDRPRWLVHEIHA